MKLDCRQYSNFWVFTFLCLIVILFDDCKNNPSKIETGYSEFEVRTVAKELSARMAKDKNLQDSSSIRAVMEHAMYISDHQSNDTSLVDFMMKAAALAKSQRHAGKAIYYWGSVAAMNVEASPMALFFQAFTIDTESKDTALATQYYRKFLEKYPNHKMAYQAQQLLDLVGKDPMSVIQKNLKNQ